MAIVYITNIKHDQDYVSKTGNVYKATAVSYYNNNYEHVKNRLITTRTLNRKPRLKAKIKEVEAGRQYQFINVKESGFWFLDDLVELDPTRELPADADDVDNPKTYTPSNNLEGVSEQIATGNLEEFAEGMGKLVEHLRAELSEGLVLRLKSETEEEK